MHKATDKRRTFQRTVDSSRRSDLAYEAIREAISLGQFEPGQWLRQEALAEELNVSSVTVREAFTRLVTEGLVAHIPYKGVKVVALPPEELEDIWQLRALIEGFAWELSADHITTDALSRMRELLPQTMLGESVQTAEESWRTNRKFHMIAIRATGRHHLIRISGQLIDMTNPYFLLNESAEQDRLRSYEGESREHNEMVNALEARDGKLARTLATEHVLSTLEFLQGLLNNTGL